MKKVAHRIRSAVLFATSIVIFSALIIQFIYGLLHATNIPGYIEQFFTYFTILSNIFIAIVFLLEATTSNLAKETVLEFASIRGAAVFCILTTGIVYSLLLRGPSAHGQVEYSISWINSTFHYIVPLLALFDWIVFPPSVRINWSTVFSWLGLTLVYLGIVEIAGLVTHTYPYFFLNPIMFRGYTGVLTASAIFLPFFVVFSLLIITISNVQYHFRKKHALRADLII